jgi:hypothetical protein
MSDQVLARSIIPKDGVLFTSVCQVKPFEGSDLIGAGRSQATQESPVAPVDLAVERRR